MFEAPHLDEELYENPLQFLPERWQVSFFFFKYIWTLYKNMLGTNFKYNVVVEYTYTSKKHSCNYFWYNLDILGK